MARDWTNDPPRTTDELEAALIAQGVLPKHAREAKMGTDEAISVHAAARAKPSSGEEVDG